MPTEGFRGSFSLRVFRSFAIAILILLAFFTLFFVYYQKRQVRGSLIKEGRVLSTLLAGSTKTAVFAENKPLLRDAALAVLKQKDVLAVQILDVHKKILASERKKNVSARSVKELSATGAGGELPELSESRDAITVVSPVTITVYASQAEMLYFEHPSAGKERVVGFISVAMDKEALSKETTAILLRSAIIALIFLALGAMIIVFALRRTMGPLMRLTDAVTLLGKGEAVGKVPVETSDEVGRLAAAFNTMSDNLKAREEEKESLEEKLRLARTMEAIGTLARGIAHDFNNILSTVQGLVYILEKKLYEDSPLRGYTARISLSLSKAKGLIQSLLTFSRTQTISPRPTDINALIRKMRPLLAGILGENIRLEVRLPEGEMIIKADPVQVEQIIMNLCTNARDAMPDGGSVNIESEAVVIEAQGDTEAGEEGPGRYVCVKISDTGAGMDEEIKEHIFEPFFTTKMSGEGNGLGLAIVYGIVEQHGGSIDVSAAPGEGTEFRLYFPLIQEKAAKEE